MKFEVAIVPRQFFNYIFLNSLRQSMEKKNKFDFIENRWFVNFPIFCSVLTVFPKYLEE